MTASDSTQHVSSTTKPRIIRTPKSKDIPYAMIRRDTLQDDSLAKLLACSKLHTFASDKEARGISGGVYFLYHIGWNLYKIGITSYSVLTRTSHIASDMRINRKQLRIVMFIQIARDRYELEDKLHKLFNQSRVILLSDEKRYVEWFALDNDDVEYIKQLAGGA